MPPDGCRRRGGFLCGERRHSDLYKWADKLLPAISSDLVADCFALAWDIRGVDMQASPYDLADWGYEPIRIEAPEGRAAYVRRQREFSERAQELRARLLEALDRLLEALDRLKTLSDDSVKLP